MKQRSEYISLIKLLESICYSYHSHEYAPLGVWEAMDRLGDMAIEHLHKEGTTRKGGNFKDGAY